MLGQCWLWIKGPVDMAFKFGKWGLQSWVPFVFQLGELVAIRPSKGTFTQMSYHCHLIHSSWVLHTMFFFQFVPWQNGCSSAGSFQLPSRSDFSLPAPSSLSASCCEGFLSDRVRGSATSPRLPCSFPIVSSLGPVPLLRYLHSRRLTWTSFILLILPSPSSFDWLITLLHPSV